jgi:hypothetical protein
MEDLKRQFQEETKLSFDDIPINGVHLEYINWLEKRIEALSLGDVVGRSEQLFCYHEGSYTLNEDGTCCKCHRPLKPKAK